jgi:RimJ/RimL family protein N-acetyltransferase
MSLQVREMELSEFEMVIDYFHGATPEHLETLGVDPTRLPRPEAWREVLQRDYAQPRERRASILALWLRDDVAVGFSTCDKIVFGTRANMHLHIVEPDRRWKGDGTEFVRRSIDFYFDHLRIKTLFCEPNAFNVAPNRTLQKAGFKYLKTYHTVPGPLNFHQAVTRWVVER